MQNCPPTAKYVAHWFRPVSDSQLKRRRIGPLCNSPRHSKQLPRAAPALCAERTGRYRWLVRVVNAKQHAPRPQTPFRQPPPVFRVESDGLPRERPQAREGGAEAVDLLGVPRSGLRAQQPGVHRQDSAVHHQGRPRRQARRQSLSLGEVKWYGGVADFCVLVRGRQLVLSERAASCVVLLGIERHAFTAVQHCVKGGIFLARGGGAGGR